MQNNDLIRIENLNYFHGKGLLRKQILYDINLSIKAGEVVIISGPSGSGKTTLLSLIAGVRSLQEGSLKILDLELYRASNQKVLQLRQQLGYIFQSHNLIPFYTALQNVQMSLKLNEKISHKEAQQKAEEILAAVGLKDQSAYSPHQLSEGQKQRVAIARALVTNPKIVLADEPTASLDKDNGRNVVELMRKLANEQYCTIILVTHDNRILDIADRIIHLEDGRLYKNPV